MWFAAIGLVPAFIWLVERRNPSMRHFATFCLFHAAAWLMFGVVAEKYLCPTAKDHPACIGVSYGTLDTPQ